MNDQRDKSLGELFGQLARETATLVRDEVALARTEIEGKLRDAARAVPALGIAALLGIGAFGAPMRSRSLRSRWPCPSGPPR